MRFGVGLNPQTEAGVFVTSKLAKRRGETILCFDGWAGRARPIPYTVHAATGEKAKVVIEAAATAAFRLDIKPAS